MRIIKETTVTIDDGVNFVVEAELEVDEVSYEIDVVSVDFTEEKLLSLVTKNFKEQVEEQANDWDGFGMIEDEKSWDDECRREEREGR